MQRHYPSSAVAVAHHTPLHVDVLPQSSSLRYHVGDMESDTEADAWVYCLTRAAVATARHARRHGALARRVTPGSVLVAQNASDEWRIAGRSAPPLYNAPHPRRFVFHLIIGDATPTYVATDAAARRLSALLVFYGVRSLAVERDAGVAWTVLGERLVQAISALGDLPELRIVLFSRPSKRRVADHPRKRTERRAEARRAAAAATDSSTAASAERVGSVRGDEGGAGSENGGKEEEEEAEAEDDDDSDREIANWAD
jgi:hypothetical protein